MTARVIHGNALSVLQQFPAVSAQVCVTSPPYYGLRDYGEAEQIGLEETPELYVEQLVQVFREVRRVLADDGTLWLNIGDSYATSAKTGEYAPNGSTIKQGRKLEALRATPRPARISEGLKQKDLIGIPWMLAFALRADGWYLRQDIIWAKPNPMPESVTDRCTKAHEYVFLLSKSPRYFYNAEAIAEPAVAGDRGSRFDSGKTMAAVEQTGRPVGRGPRAAGNKSHKYVSAYEGSSSEEHRTKSGLLKIADTAFDTRNKRSVWTISPKPFADAHFAVMPLELAETCILAGSRAGDTVLDPFMGAYTTAYAALLHGRNAIGAELNAEYMRIGEKRIRPLLAQPRLVVAS